VRVTVLDRATGRRAAGTASMDFSNKAAEARRRVLYHFGKVDKVSYLHGGAQLRYSTNDYSVEGVASLIPSLIVVGGNDIEAVKAYFADEAMLRFICGQMGFPYESLAGGGYKLLLEPVLYLYYDGDGWAFTATEMALYGGIYPGAFSGMREWTRQNLPLSLLLEWDEPEFGLQAWQGAMSGIQGFDDMRRHQGMATVSFARIPGEPVPTPTPPATPDFTYRTDTEVYTYVDIYNGNNFGFPHGSGDFSDPGIPAAHRHEKPWQPLEVTFTDDSGAVLGGGPYLLHIGAYGSGRAFVKWRTPASPAAGTISVSVRRQDGGTLL
jgi:hypothetical protein